MFFISIIGPNSKYAIIPALLNDDSKDFPTNESDVEHNDNKYANC